MNTTFSQLLTVAALTIGISLLVAVVIKGLVTILDRSARTPQRVETPPAAARTPVSDGPPEEHVAVIAAAVSVAFDQDARIVHIEPARADTGWSASGRAALHGSHRLGRRTPRRPSTPRPSDN